MTIFATCDAGPRSRQPPIAVFRLTPGRSANRCIRMEVTRGWDARRVLDFVVLPSDLTCDLFDENC